jgi:hypothetical protein
VSATPQYTYVKDDVTYDVGRLSSKGQSVFGVLVNAQGKLREAELNVTLSRASIMTLTGSMDEHLVDDAIIENPNEETNEE